MHIRTPRTAGFTLIEMLVVITIVALLVALLLPSLAGAKDAAYIALCQSNMRQLSMQALGVYAGDYNDTIVPSIGKCENNLRYNNYLSVSLASTTLGWSQFNGWSVDMWELLDSTRPTNVWGLPPGDHQGYAYCPAEQPWRLGNWIGHTPNFRETTYAMNLLLSYHLLGKTITYTKVNSVTRASRKLLFAETHHTGVHGVRNSFSTTLWEADYAQTLMYPTPKYIAGYTEFVSPSRHREGFGTSYIDGRVEFTKHPPVYHPIIYPNDPDGVISSPFYNRTVQQIKELWSPTEKWPLPTS